MLQVRRVRRNVVYSNGGGDGDGDDDGDGGGGDGDGYYIVLLRSLSTLKIVA